MNPLTTHTHKQGVTYWEHWGFAMGIAYRLIISVWAFALHAMLPFISIKPKLNLEATVAFLEDRNQWIETAKYRSNDRVNDGETGSGLAHV